MTDIFAGKPEHQILTATKTLQKVAQLPATAHIIGDLTGKAAGLVFLSTWKAGILYVGAQKGAGFVILKSPNGQWTAPSFFDWHALGGGLTLGVSKADTMMVLNTEAAANQYRSSDAGFKFGAGLHVDYIKPNEAMDSAMGDSLMAKLQTGEKDCFTFSFAQGLLADLTASAGMTTPAAGLNARLYPSLGRPTPAQVLEGQVQPPAFAKPLYDALHSLHNTQAPPAGSPPVFGAQGQPSTF